MIYKEMLSKLQERIDSEVTFATELYYSMRDGYEKNYFDILRAIKVKITEAQKDYMYKLLWNDLYKDTEFALDSVNANTRRAGETLRKLMNELALEGLDEDRY